MKKKKVIIGLCAATMGAAIIATGIRSFAAGTEEEPVNIICNSGQITNNGEGVSIERETILINNIIDVNKDGDENISFSVERDKKGKYEKKIKDSIEKYEDKHMPDREPEEKPKEKPEYMPEDGQNNQDLSISPSEFIPNESE